MSYRGVLLDFGGVVANVRPKLLGEAGISPYIADVNDDVIAQVQRLRNSGTRCALVTNNDRSGFAHHFDLPLEDWFDAVVFSSDVDADKPHPPIYKEALRLLGLPAEDCLFVDDLAVNVDAAIALGMAGLVVDSPAEAARHLERIRDE